MLIGASRKKRALSPTLKYILMIVYLQTQFRVISCGYSAQSNETLKVLVRHRRQGDSDPWWAQGNNRPFNVPQTTATQEPLPWWASQPETTTRRQVTRTTSKPRRPVNRPVWSNSDTTQTRPVSGKSKSEQKCDEYSAPVRPTVSALPLTPDSNPVVVTVEKCDYASLELIVGGTKTKPGEFPHMAAVGYSSNGVIDWDCGGSLISEYFVITAAHCTTSNKGPPFVVRLGEQDLSTDNDGAEPVNYRVVQIIKHPGHKHPIRYNDIALLRLADKVKFSKFIRPACLYTRNTFDLQKTVATGWGRIDFAEDKSDTLLKVALDIIDQRKCNELHQSGRNQNILKDGIAPSMLCAGDLKGGKDTCQGDSGGPIQIQNPKNQCVHYVIGITSFGKACAFENSAGVYTRISYYIPWIESIVWP